MKRLLFLFGMMALFSVAAFAQGEARPPQRGSLNAATSACTPTNAASSVVLTLGPNDSGVAVQVSGTFAGTVSFALTADGANWTAASGSPVSAGAAVSSTTAAGVWQLNAAGMTGACAFMSAFTSGLAQVVVKSSQGAPDDSTVTLTGTSNVNIAQINGAAPAAGNPAFVAVCSGSICAGITNSGLNVNGTAASGAATVGNPVYVCGLSGTLCQALQMGTSGAQLGALQVERVAAITANVTDPNIGSASIAISSATTTQLVALSGTKKVYITGYGMTVGTTVATANTVQFVYGTGSNCAAGQTVMTGGMSGATEVSITGDNLPSYLNAGDGAASLFATTAGQAVCLKTTGTQNVGGWVSYVQFFYEQPLDPMTIPDWAEMPVWHSHRPRFTPLRMSGF